MVTPRSKTQAAKRTKGLLPKAKKTTRNSAPAKAREGQELMTVQDAYERLLKMRGKVKFSLTWQELRGPE